jgi:hypothetical protein
MIASSSALAKMEPVLRGNVFQLTLHQVRSAFLFFVVWHSSQTYFGSFYAWGLFSVGYVFLHFLFFFFFFPCVLERRHHPAEDLFRVERDARRGTHHAGLAVKIGLRRGASQLQSLYGLGGDNSHSQE